jgi:predicted DNA-binding transcriptional regulator AlpA
MTKRWLGYRQMTAKLNISKTEIGRWVVDGKLPEPMRLGGHKNSRTVWWEHEVDAAMEALDNRTKRPE